MKYKLRLEQDFPALGRKKCEDDGFGHMIEEVESEIDSKDVDREEAKKDTVDLADKKEEDNILKVNPEDFDYDEVNDIVKPRSAKAFDDLVEKHPSVDKLKRDNKRDMKVAELKKKILDTLRVEEKKKRDLSCESVRSGCSSWGNGGAGSERDRSSDSRGEIRMRSDDENPGPKPKKSQRKTRSLLKPPKIVISQ